MAMLYPNFTFNIYSSYLCTSFQLSDFPHKIQRLGSARNLWMASSDFLQALRQTRKYFENNAQTLGILLEKVKSSKSSKQATRKKRFGRRETRGLAEPDRNELTVALDNLSIALDEFFVALTDFEDYYDEESERTFSQFQIETKVCFALNVFPM